MREICHTNAHHHSFVSARPLADLRSEHSERSGEWRDRRAASEWIASALRSPRRAASVISGASGTTLYIRDTRTLAVNGIAALVVVVESAPRRLVLPGLATEMIIARDNRDSASVTTCRKPTVATGMWARGSRSRERRVASSSSSSRLTTSNHDDLAGQSSRGRRRARAHNTSLCCRRRWTRYTQLTSGERRRVRGGARWRTSTRSTRRRRRTSSTWRSATSRWCRTRSWSAGLATWRCKFLPRGATPSGEKFFVVWRSDGGRGVGGDSCFHKEERLTKPPDLVNYDVRVSPVIVSTSPTLFFLDEKMHIQRSMDLKRIIKLSLTLESSKYFYSTFVFKDFQRQISSLKNHVKERCWSVRFLFQIRSQ